MSNVLKMLSRGGAAAAPTDPNFNQTVLLLHGDGTNGAQNNTFLDGSTNNFTITRNGNTTQGTFSPFSLPDGQWSNFFDGSGDFLQTASSANLTLGTGDFSISIWIYPVVSATATTGIFGIGADGVTGSMQIMQKYPTGGNNVLTINATNGTAVVTTGTINVNSWNHIAVSRASGTLSVYLNGTRVANTSFSDNLTGTIASIGRSFYNSVQAHLTGYIADLRVIKGDAIYSGTTITVPTTPSTAITNTSLLTCQSNRFKDNSTNNFAITRNGDTRVTPFSPFAPSAAYSPSVNGGSGYFDGSGDYLSVADNAAFDLPNDFTLEGWVYFGGLSANREIFGLGSENAAQNGFGFYWAAGAVNKLRFYSNGATVITCSTTLVANTWYHLAIVRNGSGSNNLVIYVNGVSDGTATNTTSFTGVANNGFAVGANYASSYISAMLGYISNVRLTKSAVYTAAFTPPTSPVTAITNTSLLCNFTNAGIFDNTGKNNLETVGDAQIDTSVVKYGTGSMEFDGNGDYLRAATWPAFQFGSENLTIEMWFYQTSRAAFSGLFRLDGSGTGFNAAMYFTIGSNTTSGYAFLVANNAKNGFAVNMNLVSVGLPSLNVWNHVAIVRNGSTWTVYINGTSVGTATYSGTVNIPIGPLEIGWAGTTDSYFTGYIDDLRITKGIARYTANFTPPTAAFEDQ